MGRALLAIGDAAPRRAMVLVLLVALATLGAGAALRSTEYDETYTRLVTSPTPRPDWPAIPFTLPEAASVLDAVVGPAQVALNLRETDVHPPLYFWLAGVWRAAGGSSVEALRALSVLLALGAVAAFMAAARVAGLPPVATGLATALAYGFAYTGGVARGFALAHLLLGLGALGILLAWRRQRGWEAFWGGLAAGGASFANYLAAFPAAALVGWLLVAPMPWARRLRLAAAAALPFGLIQAANMHFFLAQRGSRPDQFEPFAPVEALALLAQFNLANLFGGLPLYVEGPARLLLAAGVAGLAAVAVLAVALRWGAIGPTRWLWLGGFVAPSAGLLVLGAVFGTMPIELRYVAFAAPFAAALLAGAASGWRRRAPRLAVAAFCLVLAVQAAGAAGMALHPATRQAYRDALAAVAPALGPDALLLVPLGNDGVGIVGAALAEAPRHQPILVLRLSEIPALPRQVAPYARLVLLGITDRDGALQVAAARAALAEDPSWVERNRPWRDARRGFEARILDRAGTAPLARSGVADRSEGVAVGGAHHGGEQP
ncbi:hypothetical protein [Falsiroseomonas sp.]|uniref:hypothetical protein n=1 Tax=Falsiroseomonas sp. TaxID=2870721 RepID=UPI0034A2FC84